MRIRLCIVVVSWNSCFPIRKDCFSLTKRNFFWHWLFSYDPTKPGSESETDLDVASIGSDDSAFDFPFMSGVEVVAEGNVEEGNESQDEVMSHPEEISSEPAYSPISARKRAPEARQYYQDWNHFGGAKALTASTPRDYWDSRVIQEPVGRRNLFDNRRGEGGPSLPTKNPHAQQPNAKLGKFNAPAAFEKGIKQSEKYERWLKWKTTFDIALSICDGIPTDFQKVGLLHTYVGDEIRDVISMLNLPPMNSGSHGQHSDYEALSKGLNDYFRALVDSTTDFTRYNARKQAMGESVHQFAMKLRDLAIRVDIGHESIGFRHQFLGGLANRQLAKKATEEGLTIGEVIQQAGRIEQAMEIEESKPWAESNQQQAAVMAVAGEKGWKKAARQKGSAKRSASERGSSPASKWKQCGTCGRRQHETGRGCPAMGKKCLKCGGEGHFAAVCKRAGVNNVGANDSREQPLASSEMKQAQVHEDS